METNESAEKEFSGMMDININSPVSTQDKPMNSRKKVENPKNITSTISNKTPTITRDS